MIFYELFIRYIYNAINQIYVYILIDIHVWYFNNFFWTLTRIFIWYNRNVKKSKYTYWYVARCKWIPNVTIKAATGWLMIINLALRVNSARSYTRIFALVINASLRVSAIRVLHAFRSAALIRITGIIRQTGARTRAVALFTHGVCTTWRRIAWQLRWENGYKAKKYLEYADYNKLQIIINQF